LDLRSRTTLTGLLTLWAAMAAAAETNCEQVDLPPYPPPSLLTCLKCQIL
jgi:hypothetical protein